MSKQEDFRWPEKPLEKPQVEYQRKPNIKDSRNETRISKKAEMKRKFNRNQKRITL